MTVNVIILLTLTINLTLILLLTITLTITLTLALTLILTLILTLFLKGLKASMDHSENSFTVSTERQRELRKKLQSHCHKASLKHIIGKKNSPQFNSDADPNVTLNLF